MSETLIPVTDVTNAEEFFEAHAQATASAKAQLESGDMFVMISMPKDGVKVTALAGEQELAQAVYGLLSTYGAELLGKAANNLPPELADTMKVVTGLNRMQQLVRMMMAPTTPAGDISKTEH